MLAVKGLSKSYKIRRHWYLKSEIKEVFSGIDFGLLEGENLLISAPSGVGKSTLVRIICGLERPSGGEVLFNGVNPHALARPELRLFRRQISYIFQDQKLALNPYKTARALLFDIFDNFKMPRDLARILRFFEGFGLDEGILGRKSPDLSGGEAARIGLIRSLLLCPKLLILDEVTSPLDLLSAKKILDFLKDYQKNHKISYIFITHQTELLRDFEYKILKM